MNATRRFTTTGYDATASHHIDIFSRIATLQVTAGVRTQLVRVY